MTLCNNRIWAAKNSFSSEQYMFQFHFLSFSGGKSFHCMWSWANANSSSGDLKVVPLDSQ
jgi:hypothetical protein